MEKYTGTPASEAPSLEQQVRQIVREEIAAANEATAISFLKSLKDKVRSPAAIHQQPPEAAKQ